MRAFKPILAGLIVLIIIVAIPAQAAQRKLSSAYEGAASGGGGVQESSKAIQVNGQVRNLSMMLVLKDEKDKIKFVKVRRDFRSEVLKTNY